MQSKPSTSTDNPSNSPSSQNDPLTSNQGLQIKQVIKTSLIMTASILLINAILTVLSLYLLEGDVYSFLFIFFFLESGILFIISGLHAILGTSPSLNLLIGKLFRDEDRPLRMEQMKAIHRAIDYFVAALSVFLVSFFFFKILASSLI